MKLFKDDFSADINAHSDDHKSISNNIKIALYTFYDKLLKNYPVNQFVYIFLLFIESVELIYYPVVILSDYFDVLYDITDNWFFMYIYIVDSCIIFIYLVMFGILFGLTYYRINNGVNSKTGSNQSYMNSMVVKSDCFDCLFKTYSFMLSIYEFVFYLPSLWLFMISLVSPAKDTFLKQIGFIVLSPFVLVLSTILMGLTVFFYHDEELGSNLPWSMLPLFVCGVKIVKELVMAFVVNYSRDNTFCEIALLILCILELMEIINLVRVQEMPKKLIEITINLFAVSVFTFTFLILINLVLVDFIVDYPALFIIIATTAGLFIILFKRRQKLEIVAKKDIQHDYKQYIRQLIYLMKVESDKNNTNSLLISFLKYHYRNCFNPDCPCKAMDLYDKDDYDDQSSLVYRADDNRNNVDLRDKITSIKSNKTLYVFLNYLVKTEQARTDNIAESYILSAEIQLKYLSNEFQALYELQEAQDCNPAVQEEYLIYRLKSAIEIKIMENNLKGATRSGQSIDKWIEFHEKFIQLQDLIIAATGFYSKFWKELLREYPEYNEFSEYGYRIAVALGRISISFREMVKIIPNNIKLYMVYVLFLNKVTKDATSAFDLYLETKILMDSYYVNKKRWDDNSENKYGENSSSAIILISGNKASIGTIMNANNELWEVLGYEKSTIIGQNVSLLMPEVIAAHHNKFIQNAFTNSIASVINSEERFVFPQHAEGYLVPCMLLTKLIPNLSRGIQFIGFLNKANYVDFLRNGESQVKPINYLILLLDKEMKVQGFNKEFASILSLKSSSIKLKKYIEADRKIDMSVNYPSVFFPENAELLASDAGVTTTLDLTDTMNQLREEVMDEIEVDQQDILIKELSTNIKVKDFSYLNGKLTYKICTIALDSMGIKALCGEQEDLEGNNQENKYKLEELNKLQLNDEASVSQTTTSTSTQSNFDNRLVKDFRGRMNSAHDPCAIQCFQYVSYLLLIILLTAYIVTYVLKIQLMNVFNDGVMLMIEKCRRMDYTIGLVYDLRIVRNVYTNSQRNASEVLPDRSKHFFTALVPESTALIALQEKIDDRQSANGFWESSDRFNEPDSLTLIGVNSWDFGDEKVLGESIKASLDISIRQMVARITDIAGVAFDDVMNQTITGTELFTWNRNMGFVIHNAINVVIPVLQKSTEEILGTVSTKGNKDQVRFNLITILVICCSIACLLLLLPFIYKAHTGILVVINIFVKLPREDIESMLQSLDEYKKLINKNATELTKEFNKTDFNEDLNQVANSKDNPKNKKKEQPIRKSSSNENEETIDREKIDAQLKEIELKRKIEQVNAASTNSRNRLLIEIFCLVLIIGGYFLMSILIKNNYFGKMNLLLQVINAYSYTFPLMNYMVMISMEDFSEGSINNIAFWNNTDSEFQRSYKLLSNNMVERESLEGILEKNFGALFTMINEMNSDKLCEIATYKDDIGVKCNSAFYRIMSYGFENCVTQFILEMDLIYNRFLFSLNSSEGQQYIRTLLNSDRYVQIVDLNSALLTPVAESFTNNLITHGVNYLNGVSRFDTYDLVIFIVLMLLAFLVALKIFLIKFNTSILKARRMLGIMPTKYIYRDLEMVKQVINQIT